MLMIACTHCEIENRETARFCLNCGAKLERPAKAAPELPPAKQSPAEPEETTPPQPAEEPSDAPEAAEPSPAKEVTTSPTETEPELPEDKEPTPEPEGKVAQEPTQPDASVDAPTEETESTLLALLPPLEPGAQLAGRYEIVDLLQETPETLLYNALDRGRCSQCNYADSELGDLFCARCGASLSGDVEHPHIQLRSLRVEGEAVIQLEEETAGQVERWFEAGGRLYAVLAVPPPPQEPKETKAFGRGVRHIVGHSSNVGLQRELDEDALLVLTLAPTFESQSRPSLGLYAVADGMGGHAGGEVASRLAVEGLAETIVKRLFLPELTGEPVLPDTPAAMLKESVQSINKRIHQLQLATHSDMGTTLTAAMVRDSAALIANVGDSRTYLWRDGRLTQITSDHSVVAQLVAAGAIRPEEIYTHPDKSAIYRSLGHMPNVIVDLFTQELQPGDWLLLCCDGAWEMLRDEGIEEVLLLEADPQRACDEIVRRSNLAGGEDNISVVIVQFERLEIGG